jgi:anti-anti-sigma factor
VALTPAAHQNTNTSEYRSGHVTLVHGLATRRGSSVAACGGELLERRAEAVVAGVVGEIVHDTAELFRQGALELLAAGDRHLVLDVSQVEYWDSSAVRALVALAQNVGRHGGHLVVTGNPRMAHVMERAGLSQLVLAASDVDAGVSAAAETSTGPAPAPGRS